MEIGNDSLLLTENSQNKNTVQVNCGLKHENYFDVFCHWYFFITFAIILIALSARFIGNYIGGYISKLNK